MTTWVQQTAIYDVCTYLLPWKQRPSPRHHQWLPLHLHREWVVWRRGWLGIDRLGGIWSWPWCRVEILCGWCWCCRFCGWSCPPITVIIPYLAEISVLTSNLQSSPAVPRWAMGAMLCLWLYCNRLQSCSVFGDKQRTFQLLKVELIDHYLYVGIS